MTEQLPEQDRLWEEALDLAIRLQSDPGNSVALELVRSWRTRSPAHELAWQEVAEIHGMAGQVLLDQRRQVEKQERRLTRRTLLVAGGVGLGGAVLGAALGPRLLLEAQADFFTAKAEIRQVTLADGSLATLGPESAIKLDFGTAARRVALLSGMAYFEVARDSTRPFSVISGQVTATALGTAFDVAADADRVSVSVQHGLVAVEAPDVPGGTGQRLAAGEWLSVDRLVQTLDRGVRDGVQIGAWRDNLLIVERERIASVVARIGRWLPGAIVMTDAGLASRQISGVFDLDQPESALQAVVHPYGGKVRRLTPWVTVISQI